jgi:hypothetical protein
MPACCVAYTQRRMARRLVALALAVIVMGALWRPRSAKPVRDAPRTPRINRLPANITRVMPRPRPLVLHSVLRTSAATLTSFRVVIGRNVRPHRSQSCRL